MSCRKVIKPGPEFFIQDFIITFKFLFSWSAICIPIGIKELRCSHPETACICSLPEMEGEVDLRLSGGLCCRVRGSPEPLFTYNVGQTSSTGLLMSSNLSSGQSLRLRRTGSRQSQNMILNKNTISTWMMFSSKVHFSKMSSSIVFRVQL